MECTFYADRIKWTLRTVCNIGLRVLCGPSAFSGTLVTRPPCNCSGTCTLRENVKGGASRLNHRTFYKDLRHDESSGRHAELPPEIQTMADGALVR